MSAKYYRFFSAIIIPFFVVTLCLSSEAIAQEASPAHLIFNIPTGNALGSSDGRDVDALVEGAYTYPNKAYDAIWAFMKALNTSPTSLYDLERISTLHMKLRTRCSVFSSISLTVNLWYYSQTQQQD